MTITSASLLDTPYESSLGSSIDWITTILLGDFAIAISIVGVAAVGFIMLTGRLPLRRGVQAIIGCFVLLGAPAIAATFTGFWQGNSAQLVQQTHSADPELSGPRQELPPAQYDPYAGASLRSD